MNIICWYGNYWNISDFSLLVFVTFPTVELLRERSALSSASERAEFSFSTQCKSQPALSQSLGIHSTILFLCASLPHSRSKTAKHVCTPSFPTVNWFSESALCLVRNQISTNLHDKFAFYFHLRCDMSRVRSGFCID